MNRRRLCIAIIALSGAFAHAAPFVSSVGGGPLSSSMRIVVNGEERQLHDRPTVADLVQSLGLAGAPCAVEVNKRLVPKREHASTALAENDRVEIVTLVGGG